jgi:hypothetical protein
LSSAAEFITTSAANALAVYPHLAPGLFGADAGSPELVEHYAERLALLIGKFAASPSDRGFSPPPGGLRAPVITRPEGTSIGGVANGPLQLGDPCPSPLPKSGRGTDRW